MFIKWSSLQKSASNFTAKKFYEIDFRFSFSVKERCIGLLKASSITFLHQEKKTPNAEYESVDL